jgi:hypothetical protein
LPQASMLVIRRASLRCSSLEGSVVAAMFISSVLPQRDVESVGSPRDRGIVIDSTLVLVLHAGGSAGA